MTPSIPNLSPRMQVHCKCGELLTLSIELGNRVCISCMSQGVAVTEDAQGFKFPYLARTREPRNLVARRNL